MTFFLIALVVLCLFIAAQPAEFKVSRSARIAATPAAIFMHVNDLHKWDAWSPWAKLDPNAKMTFEGAEAGTGAITRWSGNNKVGEGSMTILESNPHTYIKFRLDFLKPMKGTSEADFTFTPDGDGTTVTWSMYGKNNFIAKAMSLIMNCEKMMGPQFEKGLGDLKRVAESSTQTLR